MKSFAVLNCAEKFGTLAGDNRAYPARGIWGLEWTLPVQSRRSQTPKWRMFESTRMAGYTPACSPSDIEKGELSHVRTNQSKL